MVRFGYADAEDPPKFAEVDDSIDGGLSKLPITTGTACSFPLGREIKVRYVDGGDGSPGDTKGPWSVWVDKIKIISANRDEQYPFAVIVERTGFRLCRFHLADDQWPYDLTSSVRPEEARPTPVECDAQLSPIVGRRDLIEYPAPGMPIRPDAGTIVVEKSREALLCKSLAQNAFKPPADAGDVNEVSDNRGSRSVSGNFSKYIFDIDNSGKPSVVYALHPGTHANDADVYFKSSGERMDSAWQNMPDEIAWQDSPYIFPTAFGSCGKGSCSSKDSDAYLVLNKSVRRKAIRYRFRYLHVTPFVWHRSTYFILTSDDTLSDSDFTVVIRPAKTKIEETCALRTVQPHL